MSEPAPERISAQPQVAASAPVVTPSGIELQRVYGPAHGGVPDAQLGQPGEYPFTRGVHPDMYRQRLWTMRQYAGFGSAEESNARYKFLLERGQTGLSVAFDLPTQIGYDPDDAMALGEVGRVGVSLPALPEALSLFDGIPLEQVSTSMTINAPAAIVLALYVAVAKRQGAELRRLRGTVQNDILKEYLARGTYIFPPQPAMRLVTDVFAWCAQHTPHWNTVSISGYHIREAGSTAVQELAFTLANGIEYVQAAQRAGLQVDDFAPQLAFFFNSHNGFLEEVAKFRAARRMWARIMRERFGARNPRSLMLRFHAQTGGSTLTAQQPENNIVRTTLQALAAVLGGAQSLHTNALDEALGLPTNHAAQIALRTQQVIASEAGVAGTVDPLGGSYAIEQLTDELEAQALAYIARIDALGGALAAIEAGYPQSEVETAAYAHQRAVESGARVVVGVNAFTAEAEPPLPVHKLDPQIEQRQVARVRALRQSRDGERASALLAQLEQAAQRAGLQVDDFAPQLAFFFNSHNGFLEEVAKFRAARRIWARIMRERFGARNPRSLMLRFHAQTGGSTLTAQQPENNIVRTTLQALAAVLGGAQSLHTNALDEALGLPTNHAAQIALRTQQVIASEAGVAGTVDPLGGSYAIEQLTDELEAQALAYIARIDALGGALAAIEAGYPQSEVETAAYAYQRAVESGARVVVGVNAFTAGAEPPLPVHKLDPQIEQRQVARVRALRQSRDGERASALLAQLEQAARGTANLMPLFIECVEHAVTLGEICRVLRSVWGEYRPKYA